LVGYLLYHIFLTQKLNRTSKIQACRDLAERKISLALATKELVRVITRKTDAPPSGGVLTDSPLAESEAQAGTKFRSYHSDFAKRFGIHSLTVRSPILFQPALRFRRGGELVALSSKRIRERAERM